MNRMENLRSSRRTGHPGTRPKSTRRAKTNRSAAAVTVQGRNKQFAEKRNRQTSAKPRAIRGRCIGDIRCRRDPLRSSTVVNQVSTPRKTIQRTRPFRTRPSPYRNRRPSKAGRISPRNWRRQKPRSSIWTRLPKPKNQNAAAGGAGLEPPRGSTFRGLGLVAGFRSRRRVSGVERNRFEIKPFPQGLFACKEEIVRRSAF